jgi:hypothetical protein
MQEFILYNRKSVPYKEIVDFIFSDNGLELALISNNHNGYQGKFHLFSRSSDKGNFIVKSLPKIDDHRDLYSYNRGLKFNKLGNICVFINDAGSKVVMLNKVNGEWYIAMILSDSWYYGLGLTQDEKNIFFIRAYKDTIVDEFSHNLEVMPIEDKILKSIPAPCYIRKCSDKRTVGYKNFHSLEQDTNYNNFTMHPSGLAVFVWDKRENTVKAIFPQKLTAMNKSKVLFTKARYYTRVFWNYTT